MSKYDEIIELAKQASGDIAVYQKDSKEFVEALAAEFANYLGVTVYSVTAEGARSDTEAESKTPWDSMTMEEDDFWHFGLAFDFPRGGQYAIPLFFRKVKDRYELHIEKDSGRKTFWIRNLDSNAFQPFLDYVFTSIKRHFESFKDFPSAKPIPGFNRARILKTLESSESE